MCDLTRPIYSEYTFRNTKVTDPTHRFEFSHGQIDKNMSSPCVLQSHEAGANAAIVENNTAPDRSKTHDAFEPALVFYSDL